jgi:hypothetical protein
MNQIDANAITKRDKLVQYDKSISLIHVLFKPCCLYNDADKTTVAVVDNLLHCFLEL